MSQQFNSFGTIIALFFYMRIKFVILSMFLAALAVTAQTRMSVDSCMRYAANHNLDVRAARISLSDSRLDQQSALASTLPSVALR